MATGPEHYRQAERLLHDAENADPSASVEDVRTLLEFAAVHAQLAQTAATMAGVFAQEAAAELLPTRQTTAWADAMQPSPEPEAAVRRRYVEPGFTQAMLDEQDRADEAF